MDCIYFHINLQYSSTDTAAGRELRSSALVLVFSVFKLCVVAPRQRQRRSAPFAMLQAAHSTAGGRTALRWCVCLDRIGTRHSSRLCRCFLTFSYTVFSPALLLSFTGSVENLRNGRQSGTGGETPSQLLLLVFLQDTKIRD